MKAAKKLDVQFMLDQIGFPLPLKTLLVGAHERARWEQMNDKHG